jgi:hypothetical protein
MMVALLEGSMILMILAPQPHKWNAVSATLHGVEFASNVTVANSVHESKQHPPISVTLAVTTKFASEVPKKAQASIIFSWDEDSNVKDFSLPQRKKH